MATPYLINPAEEKANKKKSAIITALFMLLLLIFAFFFILHQKPPEWPSGGILIDMGNTETGMGEKEPSQQESAVPPTPPQASEEQAEDVSETNEMNASEVNVQEEEKVSNETQKVEQPRENAQPVPDPPKDPVEDPKETPKYTLPGNESDKNSDSQSEGNEPGEGNMGVPDGNESPNYMGDNSGSGWGDLTGNLSGRGWISRPGKDVNYNNITGLVEAKFVITVNSDGNIINIKDARDTELTDPGIRSQLIRELKKARLKKDPARPMVSGVVTFRLQGR